MNLKKDLKIEILDIARNLFNEIGYNDVSMRDIADTLNISVGNLTYHYKRKEDLVEAVVMQRHKNYKKSAIPETLEELNYFFKKLIDHHDQNPYYFNHYMQLAQLCPKVYQIQVKVIQDMFDIIKSSCISFSKSGLMQKEDYTGQYDCIAQSLVAICIYNFPSVNKKSFSYERIDTLSCLWSIIYILLSEHGKKTYHDLKQAKVIN